MDRPKVVIDITKKERIYINPYDDRADGVHNRIPGITRGLAEVTPVDTGESGETEEAPGGAGEAGENKEE